MGSTGNAEKWMMHDELGWRVCCVEGQIKVEWRGRVILADEFHLRFVVAISVHHAVMLVGEIKAKKSGHSRS